MQFTLIVNRNSFTLTGSRGYLLLTSNLIADIENLSRLHGILNMTVPLELLN